MANDWTSNPIVLDTAHGETTYSQANDNKFTTSGTDGQKYSSKQFWIQKIRVTGAANAQAIALQNCVSSVATLANNKTFFESKSETGRLDIDCDFAEGFRVNGILPTTLPSSCKVYIYLMQ